MNILYGDKTKSFVQMLKLITRQLRIIETMYSELDFSKIVSRKLDFIKKRISKTCLNITRISKGSVEAPYPLQNADFSVKTVKILITKGESEALKILQ